MIGRYVVVCDEGRYGLLRIVFVLFGFKDCGFCFL